MNSNQIQLIDNSNNTIAISRKLFFEKLAKEEEEERLYEEQIENGYTLNRQAMKHYNEHIF